MPAGVFLPLHHPIKYLRAHFGLRFLLGCAEAFPEVVSDFHSAIVVKLIDHRSCSERVEVANGWDDRYYFEPGIRIEFSHVWPSL